MESSVNLQEPLSYAVWPIVLTGVITAAVLLFFGVCWYLKRRRRMAAELPKVVKPAPMDICQSWRILRDSMIRESLI